MQTKSLCTVFGLLAMSLVGFTGCDGQATNATSSAHTHSHDHGGNHDHGGEHAHGPHGGHIIDLGTEEFHAELTHAAEAPVVGIHLLAADSRSAAAIDAPSLTIHVSVDGTPTQYSLPAVPQPGEAAGKSSYFELTSEPLRAIVTGDTLSPNTRARLSITIGGLPFAGEIHGPGVDDTLIWKKQVTEGDFAIALGHHGSQLLAGTGVEPAVQITREGQPVDNAKVFNALLDADRDVLAVEVPTVYEPPTADEPAHYAQGALRIPPGTREAIIRFRIVLPENKGEHTFDVPVTVR